MADKRRLERTYDTYKGYVVRTTTYQKDVDAICDKAVYVYVFDRAPWWMRWFVPTIGKPYRKLTDVASADSLESTVEELQSHTEQVIDHRLPDKGEQTE